MGRGQPAHFRCFVERRRGPYEPKHAVYRTGKTHQLYGRARDHTGLRVVAFAIEVWCETCGHTGQTRHTEAADLPLRGLHFELRRQTM